MERFLLREDTIKRTKDRADVQVFELDPEYWRHVEQLTRRQELEFFR